MEPIVVFNELAGATTDSKDTLAFANQWFFALLVLDVYVERLAFQKKVSDLHRVVMLGVRRSC